MSTYEHIELILVNIMKKLEPYKQGRNTVQHKALAGQNFGGFRTARKLVEKILTADHTNNSSLFESLQHLADKTLVDCELSAKPAKVLSHQIFVLYGIKTMKNTLKLSCF